MKQAKRFLAALLTLVMFLGIFPVLNAGATSRSADDAINWVKSQEGKALDYDGQYGAQCVDLIMYYYKYLGETPVGGNGCDYAWNTLPSGWTRTKGGAPQKGDILVFSGNSSNQYGHVAICESANVIWHGRLNGVGKVQKTTNLVCNGNGFSNPYWGCIHPNFTQSTPALTATWKMNNVESLSTNDAKIGAVATFSTTITCTEAGFYLGTSQNNLKKNANPDRNFSLTHTIMGASFLMSKYKETLLSGTTYYYQIYLVANGVTYTSSISSFKTTGSAPTYTLTYNVNGGSGAPAAQTGNATYTIPSAVPTRVGYKFLGWSTSASAAAQYTAGNTITLTANTTLYAVWQNCTHTWGNGTITKPATCIATGAKTYICSSCGASQTETIPVDSNNHVNTTNISAIASTCTVKGYTAGVFCNDCKKYINGHIEQPLAAHNLTTVNKKEATCTAAGYTGDRYCTICNQTISTGNAVDALDHTAPDGRGDCTRCGAHIQDPDTTTDPTQPQPSGGCRWCGGNHSGMFAGLTRALHNIFASIFGAKY